MKKIFIAAVIVGILLAISGTARDEVREVHGKAANICFECMGIG